MELFVIAPLVGDERLDMLERVRVRAAENASLVAEMLTLGIPVPEVKFSLGAIITNPYSQYTIDEWHVEIQKTQIYEDALQLFRTAEYRRTVYLKNLAVGTKVGRFLGAMSKVRGAMDSRINGFIVAFLSLEEIMAFNAVLISMIMQGYYFRNVDISVEPFREIIVSHIRRRAKTIKTVIAVVSEMHPLYLRALFRSRQQFAEIVSLGTKSRSMLIKSVSLVDFINKFISVKENTDKKEVHVSIYEQALGIIDARKLGHGGKGYETPERLQIRRVVEGIDVANADTTAICQRIVMCYASDKGKPKGEADFVPAFQKVKRAFGAFDAPKAVVPVKKREGFVAEASSVEEAKRLALEKHLAATAAAEKKKADALLAFRKAEKTKAKCPVAKPKSPAKRGGKR
ncbi:MAG: hypothetical protein Harvfovirus2_27 [Harvfovirus sp.]|uniref:Uncharacterized protein n=1 Tax=Harvfovirus sp. TaxID=2487768 RepID=A0A3G4ZZZ6_9VIRU|nr:MAG: hypothetical protein Harvfovirus2_27 [Harvfovirus sp.]